jgi:hypothetical protein
LAVILIQSRIIRAFFFPILQLVQPVKYKLLIDCYL